MRRMYPAHGESEGGVSYRSSSGCTATAVSPRIVSGRVVATGRNSSLSAARQQHAAPIRRGRPGSSATTGSSIPPAVPPTLPQGHPPATGYLK